MPTLPRIRTALASFLVTAAFAADAPPLPPDFPVLPSDLPVQSAPVVPPATPSPVPEQAPAIRRPRITVSRPVTVNPGGTNGLRSVGTYRPGAYQAPPTVGDDVLAWDATSKEYTARLGEAAANFSFSVTNVSKSNVVINWVRPSCGCTVAKLPPTPWSLAPGEGGNIDLTVDLRGKFGTLSKYVSVDTSAGQKLLNLKITVPTGAAAAAGAPVMDARTRNMQLAMADRQAVFKGDCATCHATPTIGKTGADLFQAGCAICHEAPHRASMVPDLRALKNVTGRDYWTHWITNGKPGSLMPAFSKAQGGPLTDEQIRSLAEYLDEHFPKNIAVSAGAGSAANLPAGTAAARN